MLEMPSLCVPKVVRVGPKQESDWLNLWNMGFLSFLLKVDSCGAGGLWET